ncbi:MAG: aminoacetone oxidase family FAD-binding enzyme, partial [Chloroflexi bacterium]|nr:aminoacetone oxidase family FAD-binding enzyme [Chloroflexota bacterium]
MTERRVIVIGAGAAGLMAAGQAAELGASVLLLEKMSHPARKLRITGKGRCNLTNTAPLKEFVAHFGPGGRFLRPSLSRFFSTELCDLLAGLGVDHVVERGGRVFPASNRAQDVVDALVRWVRREGVDLRTEAAVDGLILEAGAVTGVRAGKDAHAADAVILAVGGASYPKTGST